MDEYLSIFKMNAQCGLVSQCYVDCSVIYNEGAVKCFNVYTIDNVNVFCTELFLKNASKHFNLFVRLQIWVTVHRLSASI